MISTSIYFACSWVNVVKSAFRVVNCNLATFSSKCLGSTWTPRGYLSFSEKDKYPLGVHVLPKHLDEKVARLQLTTLNADLTTLTQEQAKYIDVDINGPFKTETYRY